MKEIKVPGEVRQLIKHWRDDAAMIEKGCMPRPAGALGDLFAPHIEANVVKTLRVCAQDLEAALKRPVQRARKLSKRSTK